MENKEIANSIETKDKQENTVALRKAIRLLRDNGYIVKKLTKMQIKDSNDCEACGFEGDCSECSCSVCIIQ